MFLPNYTASEDILCYKHTEHTDTVRTSQETYYISTTEPIRLMQFKETVAVYCTSERERERKRIFGGEG
jgi:hypothetical protein